MNGIDPAIRGLCGFSLALIFGASGVMKLRDIEMFESSVANYQLLPEWTAKPFAYLITVAECASALALSMRTTRSAAASSLLVLLLIFTGAIGINLIRGRTNIDCGCFGPALRQDLSGWLLLRNLFLMILGAVVILPDSGRAPEWTDAMTIVLGALTLVILYASANFAIGNEPNARAGDALT